MNIKLKLNTLVVLILACVLNGCGLSEKPLDGQDVFISPTLKSTCEVDAKIFEKFLDEEIPEQIACLQKSLDQYSRYVKRDDERYISYDDLKNFALKFFPNNKEKLPGALKIFFRVNTLFLNDPDNKLSVEHIAPLFKLITLANKQAVILNKLLNEQNRRDSNLWHLRQEVANTMTEFKKLALDIMPADNNRPNDLDLHLFVREISENLANLNLDITTIESLFFAKKILLGGSPDKVNAGELRRLIEFSPEYTLLAFDLLYMDEKQFDSKNERLTFFSTRLESTRSLIYQWSNEESLFSKEEILTAARQLKLDQKILDKAEPALDILKNYFLGNNNKNFTSIDLSTILTYGRLALEGMQIVNSFKERGELVTSSNALLESEAFNKDIQKQVSRIKDILKIYQVLPLNLRLDKLLNDANRGFKLDENDEVLSALLGVKKLILGGTATLLTEKEIRNFIDKAADLGSLAFDAIKITDKHFIHDYNYYDFLLPRLDKINVLSNQTYENNEVLFETGELLTLAERVAEGQKLLRYKPSVDLILARIYKTEPAKIQYSTFKKLLADARRALEVLTYSATSYDFYSSELSKTTTIKTPFPYVMQGSFRNISKDNQTKWHENFNKIAMNFRFFADDNGLQYFGKEIRRFRAGFIQTALFRWGIRLIIDSYGRPDPLNPNGPYIAEIKDIETFMTDLKSILEAHGLWTRKYVTFSRNMLLLSDLFQYQSDGTLNTNEDELTEYVVLVFSAIKMNDNIYTDLLKLCPTAPTGLDNNIGFQQECVIGHYGQLLLEKNNYKQQLPLMNTYRQQVSNDEFTSFIRNVTRFTREYPEEIPMDKREVTMLTGSLMNIESTFMRFDVNNDGIIDNKELEEAFKVYRKAIIMVAQMTPKQEKYVHSVFLYMIKYMKIPKPMELAHFHYMVRKDDIVAKRLNIGAILYYLVQQANQNTPGATN